MFDEVDEILLRFENQNKRIFFKLKCPFGFGVFYYLSRLLWSHVGSFNCSGIFDLLGQIQLQ